MKTNIVLLLVVVMVAIATPAMAQKIQALNIFPYTQSEVEVPLYTQDPESMCLTDIVGTVCEVNQDAGTWKDINYSGSVDYAGSVPFSGSSYYDGPLPIAAEGTVPFETAVFDHTQSFTYAVTAPPCVSTAGSKEGCCEAKGDPDGTVHLVCYKVILNENYFESFDYDVYRQDTVNVPWTFNGTGHYAGYVPYSGSVDYSGSAPYSGTIQNAYKEYAPADVIFAEGNVVLDCPPQDQVPTQTVSFKELVTNAYVGDTIELETSGYTVLEKTVTYQVVVKFAEPGKRIFTRVFRTEKMVDTVNGVFKEQLEGGYKFEKAGTYQFLFKVWKPNGTLAGKAVTRTVIVTE